MSSPENRIFSADVQLLKLAMVDSVAVPTAITFLTATDFLGLYTDCKVNVNATIMNAKAAKDISDATNQGLGYKRAIRRSWGIDLGSLIDATAFDLEFLLAIVTNPGTGVTGDAVNSKEKYKGLVQARIWRPGTGITAGNAGYSYIGNAYIGNAKLSITSEGPVIDKCTLRGYGPLLATGV